MFRNLKKKLIHYNMTLLTIIFVAIFVVTAALMVISSRRQTESMLRHTYEDHLRSDRKGPKMFGQITAEVTVFGSVRVLSAPPQLENETAKKAVQKAFSLKKEQGSCSVSSYYFAFAVHSQGQSSFVILIDETSQRDMLINTLLILLGVCLLSLLLLYFISVVFAERTVQPVREAFLKQENFIADASHELKTPLAILKANLFVVKSNPRESVDSQMQWIGAMEKQTDRMSGLVSDMLELASLDSERKEEAVLVDFSHILTGCLLAFEAVAFDQNVTLSYDIPENIKIMGNAEKFSRLIYILLDNAVKHAQKGSEIEASLVSQKSRKVFSVSNQGDEIPPEAIQHIFDRFYRADNARSRETGGYGLGLAIAKAIAEEYHGEITASSQNGKTTFTVAFHG